MIAFIYRLFSRPKPITDTDRLNWLQEHLADIYEVHGGWSVYEAEPRPGEHEQHGSIRDAIDTAMFPNVRMSEGGHETPELK